MVAGVFIGLLCCPFTGRFEFVLDVGKDFEFWQGALKFLDVVLDECNDCPDLLKGLSLAEVRKQEPRIAWWSFEWSWFFLTCPQSGVASDLVCILYVDGIHRTLTQSEFAIVCATPLFDIVELCFDEVQL